MKIFAIAAMRADARLGRGTAPLFGMIIKEVKQTASRVKYIFGVMSPNNNLLQVRESGTVGQLGRDAVEQFKGPDFYRPRMLLGC